MKTITATEARIRFGKALDSLEKDSLLITRNGRPAAMFFTAEDGRKLILAAYAHGTISRADTMTMLGYEWYGQLLDALAETDIERPRVSDKGRRKMKATLVKSIRPHSPDGGGS